MSKILSILRLALYFAKQSKAAGELIWDYFKIEATPPMTISLLNGPFGKNLAATAEKIAESVINGIAGRIKDIEHQAVLAAKAKEAAIQAKLAKEKEAAEAAKKAAEEAKKAAASKAAAAAKASEAKKAAEAKKSEASKKPPPKKEPPKKDKKPKK